MAERHEGVLGRIIWPNPRTASRWVWFADIQAYRAWQSDLRALRPDVECQYMHYDMVDTAESLLEKVRASTEDLI